MEPYGLRAVLPPVSPRRDRACSWCFEAVEVRAVLLLLLLLPLLKQLLRVCREFMMRHMDPRLKDEQEEAARLVAGLGASMKPEERELRMEQLTLSLLDRTIQGLSLIAILSRQEYHLPRVIKQLTLPLDPKKPITLQSLKFWCAAAPGLAPEWVSFVCMAWFVLFTAIS